jgi:hypothetical protein
MRCELCAELEELSIVCLCHRISQEFMHILKCRNAESEI